MLLLVGGFYYVGWTKDLEKRLEMHGDEAVHASDWTSLHKPIKVNGKVIPIKLEYNKSQHEEDDLTRQTM